MVCCSPTVKSARRSTSGPPYKEKQMTWPAAQGDCLDRSMWATCTERHNVAGSSTDCLRALTFHLLSLILNHG